MTQYKEIILQILKEMKLTKAEVARRLGITRNAVGLALDTNRGMSMDNFLRYMKFLGAKVIVEWTDPNGRKFDWSVDDK